MNPSLGPVDSRGTGVRQGDALTVLRTLPSESVHCCVTLSVNPVMHSALVRFEGPQFQEERLHLAHGVRWHRGRSRATKLMPVWGVLGSNALNGENNLSLSFLEYQKW